MITVAEVERLTGVHVNGLLGVTSPGQFGGMGLNCTWHLVSPDIQAPAVVLQYERARDASGERAYLEGLVTSGVAAPVKGLGDVAVRVGADSLTIDGTRGNTIFHVLVQCHDKTVDLPGQVALLETVARLVVSRLP